MSNALAGSQSVKDRILLEYVPSGQEYLQTIIEAMKENRILNISYRSYRKNEENNFDVEPFCVKLFHQRWYLVACGTYAYYQQKWPRIYALDRITFIGKTDKAFKMPEGWSGKEFFENCFGIIAGDGTKVECIKLKVSAGQANYIRDLKLHASQQEIERNTEYSIFTCYLRPTYDFQQELLWHGEDMEVLEPLWLRKEMAERTKKIWEKYNKDK